VSASDRAADLDETLVIEAPDLALCGSRVTEGRIAQTRPRERSSAPATTVELRPARVSELTHLRRMSPQPEAFDRVLVAHGSIRVLSSAGRVIGAVAWLEPGAPAPDAPLAAGAVLRAVRRRRPPAPGTRPSAARGVLRRAARARNRPPRR
jgi:hypothetical protein